VKSPALCATVSAGMPRTLAAVVLVAVLGCHHAATPPPAPRSLRVRVFTEPAPVRVLASAGRYVFVASAGELARWDAHGGILPLSAAEGLAGAQIVALAPDVDPRRAVWILTDKHLGHYDVGSETFHKLPLAPDALDFAALAAGGTTLAPTGDGGVWLGTARGLYRVGERGEVDPAISVTEPVATLVRDRQGWLWIATRSGLVARKPTGELVHVTAAHGLDVAAPRIVIELPDDRLLVIGADDTGRDVLAFGRELAWATYRAYPEVHWDAAARRGTGAIAMAGDRLYRIAPADGAPRPLARDGLRLVGRGREAWLIDPIDLVVPPGAMTLASMDDQLLIGTRDLGTALYRDGDPRPHDWLRRRQMFLDATSLSVACASANDCWIATGARQAWHWTGEGFVPGGPDEIVLAVVRDPAGPLYALHRKPDDVTIALSRIDRQTSASSPNLRPGLRSNDRSGDGQSWVPVGRVALPAEQIGFARFGAAGTLWVGLRRPSDAADLAVIDVASGKTTLRSVDATQDILDGDVRGDTVWLAVTDGIARLGPGNRFELWTGLGAPRALAIDPDGNVVTATTAPGAMRWDGRTWEAPPALNFEVRDVVATRTGQLWMATERGLVGWDGKRLRRLDARRGLAEDGIIDVAVDPFDRIWARGPGSLTLVTP
jgi:hypothetical protein